jgi:hypothetical protein
MKKNKSSLIPRAASSLIPRLTMECAERYEILLCGCKKIESYSAEEVLISSDACRVCIKGCKLSICFTGNCKLMLRGIISSIEFK